MPTPLWEFIKMIDLRFFTRLMHIGRPGGASLGNPVKNSRLRHHWVQEGVPFPPPLREFTIMIDLMSFKRLMHFGGPGGLP